MCYKDTVQKQNEEKLKKKLDEVGIPRYMRSYFLIKIKSKAGAINYLGVIKDLLNYFMENKIIDRKTISEICPEDFSDIMAENITAYLQMKEDNGMSPTTLETRKNIIRSFWNYISRVKGSNIEKDFFEDVTYKGISSNNNLVKKLPSEGQLRAMEEKIAKKPDEFVRVRNLIVLRVLKGSGIREAELAGLDVPDVFLDEDMPYIMIVPKGKFRKVEARQVFLTGDATEAIKEWLDYRNSLKNIIEGNALFLNKNGKRLTEDNIKAIFRNYGNGVTPHMIRHWFATVMASTGNLAFATQQLGHSRMETTVNNYANGSYGMKDVLANM